MAQIFNSAVMTDSGAALLSAAQAGTATLNFVAVATGNGIHTDKSEEALKVRTSLLSQKQSFSISDKEIIENVSVKVTSTLTNESLAAGYYVNEIGLFCQDGDDSSTLTLFSIAVTAADQGDYFPAFSESGLVEIVQNFIVSVSNTANITVAIGSDVYALATDLEAHEEAGINSAEGVHGIRFYEEKLQYYDEDEEEWVDIETGGGTTIVQVPDVTIGTYYYNGTTQGPTVSYDTDNCALTGTYRATNIGEYTFTIALADPGSMMWTDFTTEPKTYTWSIENNVVTIPSANIGTYTYNGAEQGPIISNLDTDHVDVTGAKATNAGSYTLRFALRDPAVSEWSDGTTADKTYSWSIAKAALTVPTVSDTSKTYNGNAQHPTVTGYDSTTMSRTGYEYTDAGSYTLAFSLLDSDNYAWSSATTSFAWSIAKAAGAVTLSSNSVTLDGDHTSVTVTISGATGALTISSSDTSVATVSPSSMAAPGGTLTISSPNEDTGSATVTVSVAASTNYNATSATIAVEGDFAQIYGAEWDGTSTTAWSRTDAAVGFTDPVPAVNNGNGSSPFDTISPWCDIKRVTDATAGELVEIPKFYYKLTQTGNKMKIQISSAEFDGSSVSPAHMDRGDGKGVRDKIYVGRYHCASDYKSKTGVKPVASITRSAARSSIHNLGSDYYQWDFATRFTIWLLYLVEFADWNSQAKIGYGCGNNSATENMGYTDSMPYHTGTTQSSRTTYGLGTQYRYIEGLWDNVYDWLDGCYYNSSGLNLILNPANFSDSSGGTSIGTPSSGYPSKFTVSNAAGFPAFYASEASGGSDSTFSCDNWYFSASDPCLCVGGSYSQGLYRGLFYVYSSAASGSSAHRGCRLLKLP